MAIIDTKTKTMRKVEEDEIQRFATLAREKSTKAGPG